MLRGVKRIRTISRNYIETLLIYKTLVTGKINNPSQLWQLSNKFYYLFLNWLIRFIWMSSRQFSSSECSVRARKSRRSQRWADPFSCRWEPFERRRTVGEPSSRCLRPGPSGRTTLLESYSSYLVISWRICTERGIENKVSRRSFCKDFWIIMKEGIRWIKIST